jgi:hypothetical protein
MERSGSRLRLQSCFLSNFLRCSGIHDRPVARIISRPIITLTQNSSIWEAFGSLGVLNRVCCPRKRYHFDRERYCFGFGEGVLWRFVTPFERRFARFCEGLSSLRMRKYERFSGVPLEAWFCDLLRPLLRMKGMRGFLTPSGDDLHRPEDRSLVNCRELQV